MGLRGPEPKGNDTELRTTISPALDDALNQLVALSGVSKAAMVRQALHAFLSQVGVLYPEVTASLDATKTAGRTRVRSAIAHQLKGTA
jgi:hypothetical protein